MKRFNLITLISAPALVACLLGCSLFAYAQHGGIYSHDVFESHTTLMLLPGIIALSFFLGYVPAFCYLSGLLYGGNEIEQPAAEKVAEVATQSIYVGQIIDAATCRVRIKALKSFDQNSLQLSF